MSLSQPLPVVRVDGTTLVRDGDGFSVRLLLCAANMIEIEASQTVRATMTRPDGLPCIVAHTERERRLVSNGDLVARYGRPNVIAALHALAAQIMREGMTATHVFPSPPPGRLRSREGEKVPEGRMRGFLPSAKEPPAAGTPPHLTSPPTGPQAARGGEGHDSSDPTPPEAA